MASLAQLPHTFFDARDAIDALSAYEATISFDAQYDVSAVFDTQRNVVGYQVRVKDRAGFGVGYVSTVGA